MKKLFTYIIIVLPLVFSLSGCYLNKPMYNQEDADSVTSKGTEMMQAWLDENMPDAKLEECTAFIAWTNYDGNNHLTDYASGKLSQNGKLTVSDIKFNPETDFDFKKTDYGYSWSFWDEDWPTDSSYGFTIVAKKGAEMLKNHNYYYIDADEKPSKESTETILVEIEDGSFVLASGRNGSSLNLCDGKKLVQKEST